MCCKRASLESGATESSGTANWKAPPLLFPGGPSTQKTYDFDIRPDCTYWLTTHDVCSDYRDQMSPYLDIRWDRIFCPYLTIEFKQDSDDGGVERAIDRAERLVPWRSTIVSNFLTSQYTLRTRNGPRSKNTIS